MMSNLPFVEEILADLRRFKECVEDGQDVDLGRDRFDLLTQLGLLERTQRSPALWMMTQAGEDAIAQPAADEPIHQWADQDLWMDGDEADMASARAEGFKTRTLWTAPPASAHGDEAVRKDATESAIQRACGVLPEGWSMQIDLERDAGWVTLFNPWGRAVDFGQDFGSIGAHVEAAIDAAMRAQGDGGEV